ncbi:hypothetical protein TWF481_002872 [Arthrobotrys musiformis]|uniref:Retrotransposon gag domain-containing protein n=1 Tax=Arthrobotrys musiformis TaxID=47236 RepID=A0AAV9VRH8_9PEZI
MILELTPTLTHNNIITANDYANSDLIDHPPTRLQAIIKSNPFLDFLDSFCDEFRVPKVNPVEALANSTPVNLPSPDTQAPENPQSPYSRRTRSPSPPPLFRSHRNSPENDDYNCDNYDNYRRVKPFRVDNRRTTPKPKSLLPASATPTQDQTTRTDQLVVASQEVLRQNPLLLEPDSPYINSQQPLINQNLRDIQANSITFWSIVQGFCETAQNIFRGNTGFEQIYAEHLSRQVQGQHEPSAPQPQSPFHAPTIRTLTPSPSRPRPDEISPLATPEYAPPEPSDTQQSQYQQTTHNSTTSPYPSSASAFSNQTTRSITEPRSQLDDFGLESYHRFFGIEESDSTSTTDEDRHPKATMSGAAPGGGAGGGGGGGGPGGPGGPGGGAGGGMPQNFDWNLFMQTFAQGQLNMHANNNQQALLNTLTTTANLQYNQENKRPLKIEQIGEFEPESIPDLEAAYDFIQSITDACNSYPAGRVRANLRLCLKGDIATAWFASLAQKEKDEMDLSIDSWKTYLRRDYIDIVKGLREDAYQEKFY